MTNNTLKNCSVSVNANCIVFENKGRRSMIRFRNRDIQYLAHLTDRNWTSAITREYLNLDSLCTCYECFVCPTLDKDSFLKIACVVYEPDIKPGVEVDFSILYELAKGKKRIKPTAFIKGLESNKKVQAIVSEIKRHMLIHQLHVKDGTFTPKYLNTVTYVTAAYLLCLLDTLAKQKQKFKEDPEFDNTLYHVDRFSMVEQSNELAMFINGVLN